MSTTPSAWFINTDASSLSGVSPHDLWFKHGRAFTGGDVIYGNKLARLAPGDLLLMWANDLGVVGVGRVTGPWDRHTHGDDALVYVKGTKDHGREYRLPVDWFLDLRAEPMRRAEIVDRGIAKINPVAALVPIADVASVERAIDDLRSSQTEWRPRNLPAREAFARALASIGPDAHQGHRAVVRALFDLPGHAGTIDDIASQLGWSTPSTVNAHFGGLGHRLADELQYEPPRRASGDLRWWNVLAGGRDSDRGFVWQLHAEVADALVDAGWVERAPVYPDEVEADARLVEGATKQVLVNAYERNPRARAACIAHHGSACVVCGLDFGAAYGAMMSGFIHVHHLEPLADAVGPRDVDPIEDLVPVCPNCHAVMHARRPPYTPEEVRRMRG